MYKKVHMAVFVGVAIPTRSALLRDKNNLSLARISLAQISDNRS